MQSKLLRLLNSNRGRERLPIRVQADGDVATVYVYDVIVATEAEAEWWGGVSAEAFVKQIAALEAKTIRIRINSPGGDAFAARAMVQALREHPARIEVHVDGYAASAASILAVAGDHVAMAEGSFLMIHNAWTFAIGNAEDLLRVVDLLEKVDESIAATYASRSGKPTEQFRELMSAETWLTPTEAIELGLADEAVAERVENSARWDLSAYQRAPADSGPPQTEPKRPEPPKPERAQQHARNDRERRLRLLERIGA